MKHSFWGLVRRKATAKGLSKPEFLRLIGLNRRQYNAMQRFPEPRIDVAVRIAKALGISCCELLEEASR